MSLPCLIDIGQAVGFINEVIELGQLVQLGQTQLVAECCYRMGVQPYRDRAGASKGAVLSFHDNTALLQSARQLEAANLLIQAAGRFASATINALSTQIGVVDGAGLLLSANTRWCEAAPGIDAPEAGWRVGDSLLSALAATAAGGGLLQPLAAGLRSVLARQADGFELAFAGLGRLEIDIRAGRVTLSERMRAALRDTDTICRQSGDEFIALLPSVRDANDAAHLAEKLIERIAQPHEVAGQTLRVTCSAGVSLYPEDGETIDMLMRHADSAMYPAKGLGRNKVALCARELKPLHQDRVGIAAGLRLAVCCVASRPCCAGSAPSAGCCCRMSSSAWPRSLS